MVRNDWFALVRKSEVVAISDDLKLASLILSPISNSKRQLDDAVKSK